jgi:hypothetical protein
VEGGEAVPCRRRRAAVVLTGGAVGVLSNEQAREIDEYL